ncbi:MAG: transcriptional regulator [Pseudohongiella sp.]|nr:transcriptional regulator [Pseudohongiella sp.]MDO9518707.1 transcriptional regulator [Pseudohongiella sp.]MDP2128019.1 transcriptional regulator [Pseudohongiella sp.]
MTESTASNAQAHASHERWLLTVICEAVLEVRLLDELQVLGAPGWTVSDARGRGSRGVRSAGWDNDGNVRIEVVCSRAMAKLLSEHIQQKYYADYAMICYLSAVEVLRPEKF